MVKKPKERIMVYSRKERDDRTASVGARGTAYERYPTLVTL